MPRKFHPSLDGGRLQAAQGVQASLEYLYREARAAELSVAAPAIRTAARLARRETVLLLGEEAIDARLAVRNIVVDGRRTSVRLENDMWQALCEIARRHETSVNAICSLVARRRGSSSLTAALRAFALRYFRLAAGSGNDRPGEGAGMKPDCAFAPSQRGPV